MSEPDAKIRAARLVDWGPTMHGMGEIEQPATAACDFVEHSFGPGYRWCRTHLRMTAECGVLPPCPADRSNCGYCGGMGGMCIKDADGPASVGRPGV